MTMLVFLALAASAPTQEVVLLRPNAYLATHPDKVDEASQYLGRARTLLERAGLEHQTLNEPDLLASSVPEGRFLLCAYNPDMPAEVEGAVLRFLDSGGRALLCFYLSDGLRGRLKLEPLVYQAAGDAKTMEWVARGDLRLPGQPRRVRQSSWNAHLTEPASEEVRVAGRWLGLDGETSPGAALLVGPEAAFFGHILTDGDTETQAALLTSIVAHYRPGLWDRLAERALDRVFRFRHAADVAALAELGDTPRHAEQLAKLQARAHRVELLRLAGRRQKALLRSRSLREDAEDLYLASLPTREREFRGAWVVMPGGVGDWGWEKTAQVARANGLNALIVRVEWRGIAHYKSQVLRMDEEVEQGRDPLAEAVAACRKHGLQIHAWFINHNWRTPPEDLIREFSEQGRWQIGPDGREGIVEGGDRVYWLNPSDPRNVELQAKMMAEVAREYEVDGVHFDYIRYENYAGSYGAADRERFERDTQSKVDKWPEGVLPKSGDRPEGVRHGAFLEWRVQQVSNVVEACAKAVRAARPDCKLSAAVYPAWPSHRLLVGQDWPRWLKEGWIDFACPMSYDAPAYYDRHEQRVIAQREAAGPFPLYSGIGAWLQPDAVAVADQIATDRAHGVDGFVLFSYTPELGEDVLPRLHEGLLR